MIKLLIEICKRSKKPILYAAVLIILTSGFYYVATIYNQKFIDLGLASGRKSLVVAMALAICALQLGIAIADILRSRIMLIVGSRISQSATRRFFDKVVKLPLALFDQKSLSFIQQSLTDYSRIQYFAMGHVLTMFSTLAMVLAYSIAALRYNIIVFFIIISFNVVSFFLLKHFYSKRKRFDDDLYAASTAYYHASNEIVLNIQDIKLNGYESHMAGFWSRLQIEKDAVSLRQNASDNINSFIIRLISNLETLSISIITAFAVLSGRMSIGALVTMNLVAGQLRGALNGLSSFYRGYQDALISYQRLKEFEEQQVEAGQWGKLVIEDVSSIDFRDVTYQYPGQEGFRTPAITFSIHSGQTLAITGASGTGKSTILKLVTGHYKQTSGCISINGQNGLRELSLPCWRKMVRIVMQDSMLFQDTIRNNIVLDNAWDAELFQDVVEICRLSDFIEFPAGYEAVVGHNGRQLSGGQRQRVILARSIYTRPKVLILDEATSALDTGNENYILRSIKRFLSTSIIVVVTHRQGLDALFDGSFEMPERITAA